MVPCFILNLTTICLLLSGSYAVNTNKGRVSLMFVGDISFSDPVRYYVEHGYHSYNDSFNDVAPYIREADISVGNLESPFVTQEMLDDPYKMEKSVSLYASPQAASALSFSGFDAVTVANNHLNDFGSRGANFTVEVLKRTGIKHFGISFGKYDTSQEPLILKKNGIKIGFLGYCDSPSVLKNCTEMRMMFSSGPAIYTDDVAIKDIKKLKKAEVDIIVVLMHYGAERYVSLLPYQLHINKHLMSLGVDIIIGAHPHVVQGHYFKHNQLIEYSLGNFLFYPNVPMHGTHPVMYGRFGNKPNKFEIESYEHFVLGNCNDLRLSRILRITISRKGLIAADYLPLKITFDQKTKRLHPEPVKNAKWITVCGDEDPVCHCHNDITDDW
ncbi:uncharacterized protein LOC111323536 [Stylophora pistillata]|uniref:uncharacterized protein LOC111323536 n=1 Tax=Stylophora pistillata TaxID=50429 RepID=UPI000C057B3A|nr:uncharacterized protein LOC111323536 [Stylophora pistillata]